MDTLNSFYHTKGWEKLLRVIKLERLNENGELICEYCGKPIVRKYDCIGHHKIHLTEGNVNDADIALNPENIALVHHRCHNHIHQKFYGPKKNNKPKEKPPKQVFLIYGSPCSGKSTYLNSVMIQGDLVIDVDLIRQCVSGQPRHILTPQLNTLVFAIRDLLFDAAKTRRGGWLNCYIIGGFPLKSERDRIIRETGAREIYIDSSRSECMEHLKADPNNRDVEKWERFINDWWDKYERFT